MGRILALDYGLKRTGIAVTDELQIIASGLTTVNTTDLISFLTKYLENETVDLFLIGEPRQMNYTVSQSEIHILQFIKQITEEFPNIPIQRIDERFTSKLAFQAMIDGGLKKNQRKNKALIDKISATIILQSYLYSKNSE